MRIHLNMDKHIFLSANTADGTIHHFDKIVTMFGLKKLYILKGGSGVGKSTLIKKFAAAFEGTRRTFIYCSADPESLDGVVIENGTIAIGIIDGTFPHLVDPKYPAIIDEIVNLGAFIDPAKVTATKSQIDDLTACKAECYGLAFSALTHARQLHKMLEGFYADAVDFAAVNALCNKLITDAKFTAGVIRRKPERENSTK